MQRQGNQIRIYRTETLNLGVSRDKASKVKYKGPKYYTCQYQGQQKQSKIQNWNTANVNMQRQGKENKIYRTKTMQMSECKDKEIKSNIQK